MTRSDEIARSYTAGILRSLQYRAMWMPNETVELGAVGYMRNGVFERRQHLSDFGVEFNYRTQSNQARFTYQSSAGVKVTWKARGEVSDVFEVVASGRAGAHVEFSRAGASLLAASSCTVTHMVDLRAVERQLRALRDWDRNYVIVTTVVAADRCTVLVSGGKTGRVELQAAARSPAIGSLAELSSGISVVSSRGVAVEIVAQGGLTPLYRVQEFRRPFIGGTAAKQRTRLQTPRKATARKSTARKSTARKSTARKSTARKSTARG